MAIHRLPQSSEPAHEHRGAHPWTRRLLLALAAIGLLSTDVAAQPAADHSTPSVLLQHEELKLVISVYPGTVIGNPEQYAVDHACPYLRLQGLTFPVPFDLVFHRSMGGGAVGPDDTRAPIKGMLQRCP